MFLLWLVSVEGIGFLDRHIKMFAFNAESDSAGYSLLAVGRRRSVWRHPTEVDF